MKSKWKWAFFVVVLLAVAHALPVLHQGRTPESLWVQLYRLFHQFFPPDVSILPDVLKALNETIQIATLSTVIAVGVALVLAAFSNSHISPKLSVFLFRNLLILIRSIPSLVWAVVFVALVGANPRAGVYALAFYSVGYLGKFFLDSMEQIDPQAVQWVKRQGYSPLIVVRYVLWPTLKGGFISQILWMWEYNIRSASIIGYVGVGGLGLSLHIYQEYGQWNRFSTVLIVIFVIVFVLEWVGLSFKKMARIQRNSSK